VRLHVWASQGCLDISNKLTFRSNVRNFHSPHVHNQEHSAASRVRHIHEGPLRQRNKLHHSRITSGNGISASSRVATKPSTLPSPRLVWPRLGRFPAKLAQRGFPLGGNIGCRIRSRPRGVRPGTLGTTCISFPMQPGHFAAKMPSIYHPASGRGLRIPVVPG
jgi:hypothetical protein